MVELSFAKYPVADLDAVPSPRLLVFRERVERNIARMREHLENVEGVAPGTGFSHLRTHVKTHKSSWVARLMIERGITRFKATPHEIDMLVAAGARDIFVAYPLLPHHADHLTRRIAASPQVRFLAHIASTRHIEYLAAAAAQHDVTVDCLIDLDVGLHRTGAPPAVTPELYRSVARAERLRFAGLHTYDGQNKGTTVQERRSVATEAMAPVLEQLEALTGLGATVPLIVAGGTPGFLPDLEILLDRVGSISPDTRVEVSPGTWIYWDTNYDSRMPGLFEPAALVLAHVMDCCGSGFMTLNLGYKRWAIDVGPVTHFSEPGLEVVWANEEHTVLRRAAKFAGEPVLDIGHAVLIAPRHVCPTVNLWEDFTVIGPDGAVEIESSTIDGRNR